MSDDLQPALDTPTLDKARWRRIQDVFAAAIELAADARRDLLDRECGTDTALRQEVQTLLDSHERPGPLDQLAADMLSPALSGIGAVPSAEGRSVSHYVVGERLGSGGMGVVHRARDERLGRTIALKFLPPHLGGSEEAKRRFLLEARAAAALEHPNICTIYEIGETPEGELFIAMPLYDGETLQERLARGPLPIPEALAIARDTAVGLGAAHQRGIIHRDIKPSNVMLVADGRVKILDFGVAKVADVSLTGSGARIGTAAYMSPEQTTGDAVDMRTDVWSLGVVLYEMLTGRRPFEAETPSALLFAILSSPAPGVRDLRPDAPAALSDVIARALAKIPSRRFASMGELVDALDAITERGSATEDVASMPSVAERRHLAVVATVVSDYASLVEQLDFRALDDLLGRLRAEAVDVVRRHGGFVNQAIGDEIVALFGLPAGHEDDEVRAVRAAVELRTRAERLVNDATRRAGLSIALQSGIGSGSVVVQRLREGPRRYNVSGDAATVAARLAAAAGPGRVAISPECHRAVARFVTSEPGPAVDVRPGAPPLMSHVVVGERAAQARLDTVEQSDLTPYTGRNAELSRLLRIVDRACAGEGRMVTVVGEAGMGKSRLLFELRRGVAMRGVRVLQGRCQSYGGLSPYLPFVRILTEALALGVGVRPTGDEIAARITALDPSLETFVPVYLHLLSAESRTIALPRHLYGEHLHAALLDALTAIVMALAQRSPLVLLLEDWHWADEGSRDVVARLAEIVDSCAVALVVTSRPEGGGLSELSGKGEVVRLEPLDSDAAVAILRAVFQARDVDADLVSHVHERTGGNPFFLEQVAHTLLEEEAIATDGDVAIARRQLDALRLPETVQAVIRARLDRLGPDALEVLRVASVIGREFSGPLLASATDPHVDVDRALDRLRASGLVQQTHVVPERGYRFKHVLTQETAYGSLLEHQRRRLHATIGRALEHDGGGRDDLAEMLAHHFSRAEEWMDAIGYGRQAVARLRALSQYGDALTALERVQAWLPRLPDDEARRELQADLLLEQERLYETVGQRGRQQQIIAELIALLAPFGASPKLAEAYLRQGDLLTLLKQFDAADRALGTVLRMGRERQDEALERNVFRSIGLLRWHEGRHQEALELAERALAIDRRRGDEVAIAGDLSNMGAILISLGDYDRARLVLEEAVAMPILDTEPARVQYVLHNLANVHRASGDLDQAVEYLQRARQVSTGRLPIQESFNLMSLANVRLQQGRLEEALATYEHAVDLSRRARHAVGLAQGLRALGELQAGLGRGVEAVGNLSEAAALFAQLEDRDAEAQVSSVVATLRERQEDWSEAERTWRHLRSLAHALGDRRLEVDAVEGMARTARRSGDASAAVAGFDQALSLAIGLGDTARQVALHNTLGILAWERAAYADALAHYEAGLRLCRVLAHRPDEGLMLNSIGVVLVRLQRFEEARTVLEEAAALNSATGERLLESHTLVTLGDLSLRFGRAPQALEYFTRAAELRRSLGHDEADASLQDRLARARAAVGTQKG